MIMKLDLYYAQHRVHLGTDTGLTSVVFNGVKWGQDLSFTSSPAPEGLLDPGADIVAMSSRRYGA